MESPQRENDHIVKVEPGNSARSSNTYNTIGHIKEENCYDVPINQSIDGMLEVCIKSEPRYTTSNDQMLGKLKEELVVKDTIKAEMESPHRESDQEGIDKLYTDIDVTCSDVNKEEDMSNEDNNDIREYQPKAFSENTRINEHSVVKSFTCLTCSKSFPSKSRLTRHTSTHSGEKPFSCSTCSKSFNAKSTLRSHMVVHSGVKQFTCSECSKCFSKISSLKSHMLIHSGDKPFSCSICSKYFRHKSYLNRHLFDHSGNRPFTCSNCSKHFSRKSTIIRHMLTHTEKPFLCSICNKYFRRTSDLKKHMLLHSGVELFSCSICSKCFCQKSNLTRHILTHS